jgi:hypothetical protein
MKQKLFLELNAKATKFEGVILHQQNNKQQRLVPFNYDFAFSKSFSITVG